MWRYPIHVILPADILHMMKDVLCVTLCMLPVSAALLFKALQLPTVAVAVGFVNFQKWQYSFATAVSQMYAAHAFNLRTTRAH